MKPARNLRESRRLIDLRLATCLRAQVERYLISKPDLLCVRAANKNKIGMNNLISFALGSTRNNSGRSECSSATIVDCI
jgi:hypothetical protein